MSRRMAASSGKVFLRDITTCSLPEMRVLRQTVFEICCGGNRDAPFCFSVNGGAATVDLVASPNGASGRGRGDG